MAETVLRDRPASRRLSIGRKLTLLHVSIILGCGGLFRLLYLYTFKPCWSGDTEGYTYAYYLWTRHTFSIAERPPVYSLFLGLVQWLAGTAPRAEGMAPSAQYLATWLQSLLGLAAALLVYFSLRSLRIRPKIALIGGLSFALIGAVCLFGLLLLTEELSMFLIVLGIWSFVRCIRLLHGSKNFAVRALFCGFSFSLAILTRPENLIFVAVLIAAVFLLCLRCHYAPSLRWATPGLAKLGLLMSVSAAPLVLLWMSWNLVSIGEFRLSTITGVARTESVYNLFDRVEPQDRVAGAILQQFYLLKNRNGQIYRHHACVAMPFLIRGVEAGAIPVSQRDDLPHNPLLLRLRHQLCQRLGIQERTTLDGEPIVQPIGLYDYLGELSTRLAIKHPLPYLGNVMSNFLIDTLEYNFLPFSLTEMDNPQAPEGGNVVRHLTFYPVTYWVSRIEQPLLVGSHLLLMGMALFSPFFLFGRTSRHFLYDGAVLALSAASFLTIVCFCFLVSFHPEHGIPHLGVHLICAFFVFGNWKRALNGISERFPSLAHAFEDTRGNEPAESPKSSADVSF